MSGELPLAGLASLVEEIADLKRVRSADGGVRPWADRRFAAAWGRVLSGEDAEVVAVEEAARAVCAARLAAITPGQLRHGGLSADEIKAVFVRSLEEHAAALGDLLPRLRDAVGRVVHDELSGASDWGGEDAVPLPWFVTALEAQPRAGATCPGRARILLDPPESHAGHCYVVAVAGALASAREGASPRRPFLFGLTHHLHNATLADSGFAGEVMLGDRLDTVIDALFERAYADLPTGLAEEVRGMRREFAHAETADARAFHTADVLDRVAEMRFFERAATFEARTALEDLELVHAGPTQAYGQRVLREAGWWERPTGEQGTSVP